MSIAFRSHLFSSCCNETLEWVSVRLLGVCRVCRLCRLYRLWCQWNRCKFVHVLVDICCQTPSLRLWKNANDKFEVNAINGWISFITQIKQFFFYWNLCDCAKSGKAKELKGVIQKWIERLLLSNGFSLAMYWWKMVNVYECVCGCVYRYLFSLLSLLPHPVSSGSGNGKRVEKGDEGKVEVDQNRQGSLECKLTITTTRNRLNWENNCDKSRNK